MPTTIKLENGPPLSESLSASPLTFFKLRKKVIEKGAKHAHIIKTHGEHIDVTFPEGTALYTTKVYTGTEEEQERAIDRDFLSDSPIPGTLHTQLDCLDIGEKHWTSAMEPQFLLKFIKGMLEASGELTIEDSPEHESTYLSI